ncbi:hypothetical protein Spith_0769 [Spirochaeta thermophila DSM 6578]|uniref:Uncharacterized protein n=1 Tax=Winmispira thermophila (strain ATCC 700085 / DSM 6578 / Z-1203) TaxID=869211 RepID=G0GB21_WINT7|nr:alpha/beta hydrolase-fold protein [Spirochaeta thermophila]AEJ61045.1 hypothetical protein Spith_0769 [Spirochaeta thermophila DSM 6578]
MKVRLMLGCALVGVLVSCAGLKEGRSMKGSEARLERVSYVSVDDGKERDAFVYVPAGYEDTKDPWPLLLFLHGDGERGDGKEDLDYVLSYGPLYEAWIQKRDLPFIIVAPQMPMWGRDEGPDAPPYITGRSRDQIPRRLEEGVPPRITAMEWDVPYTGAVPAEVLPPIEALPPGWDRVAEDIPVLLDLVAGRYRVDESRVYLSGVSMGGIGTWIIASRYPERFAAIAPVVGFGYPEMMEPLAEARMPIWCFSGGRDPVVPTSLFFPAFIRLEDLGHRDYRFTTEQDMGHDVWVRVYAGEDLYRWLLSHRKR